MTGANVTRYVHAPTGLLAQHDGASWDWLLADGLGSVRSVVDGGANVLWSSHYAPYGSPFGGTGTAQTAYGFTGEPTDGSGLVYLRNRYYAPGLGVFASLDRLETANRYAYVGGDVVNATDPSGMVANVRPRMIDVDESRAVMPGTRLPTVTTPRPVVTQPSVVIQVPGASANPFPSTHGGNTGSPTQSSRGDEYLPPDEQAFSVRTYAVEGIK